MLKLVLLSVFLTGCAGKSINPSWFSPKPGPFWAPEKKDEPKPVEKKAEALRPKPVKVEGTTITPTVGKTLVDPHGVFKLRMDRYIHCRHYTPTEFCVRPRKPK